MTTASHAIVADMERNRKEGLELAHDQRDSDRFLTAPQRQCRLRQDESDYRVIGAVLKVCEDKLNHIVKGTFCLDFAGERRGFGKDAIEDARKYAAVVASIRRAAFGEAEKRDLEVKGLNE